MGETLARSTQILVGVSDIEVRVAPASWYSALGLVRSSYLGWKELTIDSSRHAGSEGCAPTPSQYFARAMSSLISLYGLPSS